MPAAAKDASVPSLPRSTKETSRTPRNASARAIVNPITPPPMTTTSALPFMDLIRYYRRRMHAITLIPGDGIGPEVASNVVRIIEASGVDIHWETHYAGAQALEKFGQTLPQELLDSIIQIGRASCR